MRTILGHINLTNHRNHCPQTSECVSRFQKIKQLGWGDLLRAVAALFESHLEFDRFAHLLRAAAHVEERLVWAGYSWAELSVTRQPAVVAQN
jgi:hypothetical protein